MANRPLFMFGATFPLRGKPAPIIFREGQMTRTKNLVLGLINTQGNVENSLLWPIDPCLCLGRLSHQVGSPPQSFLGRGE